MLLQKTQFKFGVTPLNITPDLVIAGALNDFL